MTTRNGRCKTPFGRHCRACPGEPKGVTCEALYWRKANAIHAWFVTYVQDGVDECQEHDVSSAQLTELRDTIREVLTDPVKNAPELLPTQKGFFFGSTDYDEYYIEQLRDTEKRLTDLLANQWDEKGWYFTYHASW